MKRLYSLFKYLIITVLVFSAVQIPVRAEETKEFNVSYYSVTTSGVCHLTVPFNDDWFKSYATNYNHELAKASFGLTVASFRPGSSETLSSNDERIVSFLTETGFSDIRSDDYDRPAGRYTIASAMGHQTIQGEDGPFELIAVGIAGQGYKDEWLSNLSIGGGILHEGFKDAADDIYDRFFGYLAEQHIEKPYKVWVSGYSRAAAVSNIFAAYLEQDEILPQEDVFAYTFATPRTTKDPQDGRHNNIFNIVGMVDPVPTVPFRDWGFERYGVTYYTPAQQTNSDWYEKEQKANAFYHSLTGLNLWNNPGVDAQLKMFTEYLLEICPTNELYASELQGRLLSLWQSHTLSEVVQLLIEISQDDKLINDDNRDEANSLLDFALYTAIDFFNGSQTINHYEDSVSLGANIVHEHTPEVYISWVFSNDDPSEIYTNKDSFTRFIIAGDVDLSIRASDDGHEIQTLSVYGKETQLDENVKLYAARINNMTIAVLPQDSSYDLVLTPRKNETMPIARINYTSEQTTITEYAMDDYQTKQNTDLMIHHEAHEDYSRENVTREGIKDSLLYGSSYLYPVLLFNKLNIFGLGWKDFLIQIIAFAASILSILLFIIIYSQGIFSFRAKQKKGVYTKDTRYYALPIFCLSLILVLFLTLENFSVLFPGTPWLRTVTKTMIGVLTVFTAWLGCRHYPSLLNKWSAFSLLVFAFADIVITYDTVAGLIIRTAAMIIMGIGFVRTNPPHAWQLAAAAVILSVVFQLLYPAFANHGQTFWLNVIMAVTSFLLFTVSLTMPRRFRLGSLMLCFAGMMLIWSELGYSNIVSHFAGSAIYYSAIIFFAAGIIKPQTALTLSSPIKFRQPVPVSNAVPQQSMNLPN